jgi:hypothetical protein
MKKFYSISIGERFVNILYIEKKKARYEVISDHIVDISEVSKFLQNKSNFYIVIDVDESIDDTVVVPSVIKKDTVLRSYILKKFKNSLVTKQLLLNYHKISHDAEESTITYKVDAIVEKTYVEKLNLIKDWLEIKSVSINKFSLLNISRKCYTNVDGFGYFSIYTHKNFITVLAIDDNGNLIFERSSNIKPDTPEMLQLTMVEEINQTISYVKQQFRNVEFSTILISGSMALDDIVAEHLLLSSNLSIAVIYPNTFISGLRNEEPQHYIITLGSFLIKKQEQFLPNKIFSLREYKFITTFLMIISFSVLFITAYFTYEKYIDYSDELERYDNIKSRLIRMVRETDTYSQKDLEISWKHLQIAERFLKDSPTDYLLKLKPLIELVKPKKYRYNNQKQDIPDLEIDFEKKFISLSKLHQFEKNFFDSYNKINKDKSLNYKDKTNYKDMVFFVSISNKKSTKKAKHMSHRRRRKR